MNVPRTLLCALALVIPTVALGDTVRMKSGQLVDGAVQDVGDRLLVKTERGDVSVRWRDVDVVLKDKSPKDLFAEKRTATDAKDAAALYALALWAGKAGLAAERKTTLESVLALDPEHEAARKALQQQKQGGEWLAGTDLLQAKGFVAKDGKWVLKEEADLIVRRGQAAKQMTDDETRVQDLLTKAAAGGRAQEFALKALAGLPEVDKFRPALRMLRRGKPAERLVAAKVLATVDDVDVLRPLIRTAVMDREANVRAEAVQALVKIDNDDVLKPIGRALFSQSAAVSMNAAEALGAIGGEPAVEYLVRRVMTSGGIGTRNHFSSMTQLSYIADFDVEIAQLAQIGDPIVGVLREGVILDTRITGVREEFTSVQRRVFYRNLKQITGQDLGENPTAWKKWWETEGKKASASQ